MVICTHCENEFECSETEMIKIYDGDLICQDCYDNNYFTCDDCNNIYATDDATNVGDKLICDDCFGDNYFSCRSCGTLDSNDNKYSFGRLDYCEDCFNDRYGTCEECGNIFDLDELDDGYCSDCSVKRVEHRIDIRPVRFCGNDSTIPKQANVGIEIEMEQCDFSAFSYALDNDSGFYNDVACKDDGSLDNTGCEFNSPIMKGSYIKNWIDQHGKFILDNSEATNNCGTHVHISFDGIDMHDYIERLHFVYQAQYSLFLTAVDSRRRRSTYCEPHKSDFGYTDRYDKYKFINFGHTTTKYKTIELRYMHGFKCCEELYEFIQFHTNLIYKVITMSPREFKKLRNQKTNSIATLIIILGTTYKYMTRFNPDTLLGTRQKIKQYICNTKFINIKDSFVEIIGGIPLDVKKHAHLMGKSINEMSCDEIDLLHENLYELRRYCHNNELECRY